MASAMTSSMSTQMRFRAGAMVSIIDDWFEVRGAGVYRGAPGKTKYGDSGCARMTTLTGDDSLGEVRNPTVDAEVRVERGAPGLVAKASGRFGRLWIRTGRL